MALSPAHCPRPVIGDYPLKRWLHPDIKSVQSFSFTWTMIPNTVEVNDKVETQSESVNLIDFSLWESRSQAINDFIRHYSFDTIGFVFISLLGFFPVISAMLGFGFYLWHLKTSNEHTQNRLLNILNGYLSAVCMNFSPAVFNLVLHIQIQIYRNRM